MDLENLRRDYHGTIFKKIIRLKDGKPNFADVCSRISCEISRKMVEQIGFPIPSGNVSGQTSGKYFGEITEDFLNKAFGLLQHIRPGDWLFSASQSNAGISIFDQYEHLAKLDEFFKKHKQLEIDLGRDYIIIPDIVIGRRPISDEEINKNGIIIESSKLKDIASLTTLRKENYSNPKPILHASISCKWTIRSDRSQNTRTEALNLIRNRKGKTPHIVAVTAEPLPTRICSLALGTGDIDCVYHFALYELIEVIERINEESQKEILDNLVKGKRLRDISDLPFDLAS